ncbi:hypothetical protein [Psychroflexus halocasei]|uniref:LTXXQ motif family protein n=1 Tax=Psychroflexus halocasei TaxID=908615 RepID=A0A1H4A1B7_9FLAO|nr:hypothetical protein [Psychroflexus halocasei]SEA29766.1 hypothetical protein SAMN05421540_104281 [Psychroflexus halocasei]
MKKIITIFILLVSITTFAQKDDKIQSLKIGFFTEKLDLSSEEAKKFWPVYNKHNNLFKNLKNNKWVSIKKRLSKIEDLPEVEAEALLTDYMSYKSEREKLRKSFVEELKTVITPKQIMTLKYAEYQFNKKLLKQYNSSSTTRD